MLDLQYHWQLFSVHLGLFIDKQANLMKALSRYLMSFDTSNLLELDDHRHQMYMSFADDVHWQSWLARRSSLSTALLIAVLIARDWLWASVCVNAACRALVWLYEGVATDRTRVWRPLCSRFFELAKCLPPVQRRIRRELDVGLRELEHQLLKPTSRAPSTGPDRSRRRCDTAQSVFNSLPDDGLSSAEIFALVDERHRDLDTIWQSGRVSGTVYAGDQILPHLPDLVMGMMRRYLWSNPLHPDVFPDVRQMEAEVIRMCINMFGGDVHQCGGSMTSGGTESILLACKAHRDYFAVRYGIRDPEIVVPVSAHAAFQKAAEYLRMRLIPIPVSPTTGRVSVRRMARALSANTVLIVASAPGFPHGIIDPVVEIARLARDRRIGCHVDACLGGFLLPFMREARAKDVSNRLRPNHDPLTQLDAVDVDDSVDFAKLLTIRGVTSVSCDTHKYGFAPKGSSVILYTDRELRRCQYSVAADWPGGIYASPTLAGSRAGATIACCWASMISIGRRGYLEATRSVLDSARRLREGIATIEGLYVIGRPTLSIVAFASRDFDIYRLGSELSARGWHLNSLQLPSCIHICVTLLHDRSSCDLLLQHIHECTATVMATRTVKASGMAAIYGMGATLPDRSIVDRMARGYLDVLYDAVADDTRTQSTDEPKKHQQDRCRQQHEE